MVGSPSAGSGVRTPLRQVRANGVSMKTEDVELKLDEGNIEEAESSLREGLSLNFEEARALLGRLEYQRGNVEGALRVFDGIDLHTALQRLQPTPSEKQLPMKGRGQSDSQHGVSHHAASLVLEAIYLKAKSLHKLGRLNEAAHECKSMLDAVESIFHQGISNAQADNRLQDIVSQAVELLPELWNQAGYYREAIVTYRRALLGQWNLDEERCARIQKQFAVFLLHSGVEAGPPCLAAQVDGSFVPKHNLEEAVLLLMIVVRKFLLGKIKFDSSVMEQLAFALSLCNQTSVFAKQLEECMPGVFHRVERWNTLALCYSGVGQSETALNLLRKSLHKHEIPDDLMALLLIANICSKEPHLAAEGVVYAQRAIANCHGQNEHLKGVAFRMLGLCLGNQAKVSSSDLERSHLLTEALKALGTAAACEQSNPDLIFELGVQHAQQRSLTAALRCAKKFIDVTGGSLLKGWRFLALVLSAQQRYAEAEVVTDAALDETTKWEQGPVLRMKAKLKLLQMLPADAIETYRNLLALVQAQRKSFGPPRNISQVEDDKLKEFEVWRGLADLYSQLSHWKDAEICLGKARELKPYSAEVLHIEGLVCQGRGNDDQAMCAYINALLMEPYYVPCKILLGATLSKLGNNALPVARTILSDALRVEPTSRMAWYHLGMIHRDDGRIADAIDCFQAASMLEESDPIESFSSVLWPAEAEYLER